MTQKNHAPSIGLQLAIYVALMVLLVLTVLAARLNLGPLALLVALVIAAIKAGLVILYFMHVRYSTRVTWLFVGAGFLWLSILFTFTFAEYVGRARLTRAQPLQQAP